MVSKLPLFWNSTEVRSQLAALGPAPAGLTSAEAQHRLKQYGLNTVSKGHRFSLIAQIVRRLIQPLVAILLVAAFVSGLTGDRVGLRIIVTMVLLSTGLDVFQERNAMRAAEALKKSIAIHCTIRRDGKLLHVDVEQVAPGDIVHLSPGDLVPADGVVIASDAGRANEALMTGEPYPVEKRCGPSNAQSASDAYDALFGGTALVSGAVQMLVTTTGANTALGGIAKALETNEPPTAFERGLHQLGILILRLTVFLVSFVLLAHLAFHRPPLESFMFAVALAVGLTPELLPMVTTVTLSRGAVRLAKRKVIVKKMSAIHDLGSMDVFCTDKTGTLTEAHIELASICDAHGHNDHVVLQLAALDTQDSGNSNPLDSAIKAASSGFDFSGWHVTEDVPFDFERRRASVVVEHNGKRLLITKGAPESVLALSTQAGQPDQAMEVLDAALRSQIVSLLEAQAANGLRLLGVAWRELPAGIEPQVSDERDLVFSGLCAFADPPKTSAGLAIARLQKQGVRVKIISGDAAAVVQHLVASLGIDAKGLLTGEAISDMNDHALAAAVETTDLYARVSPDQKVRIVRALSAAGHVVGFLGDGINDAPAIRAADAGISVQGATDVARAAADLILLDADLGVLADGVEEGRRTYANIMKYIRMGTSSNFGNMLSMALASLVIPFLPMTAVQILLNNLLYDFSQTGIPFDNVDPEEAKSPHHLDMKSIVKFTLVMGPLSSVFDIATFAILLFFFQAQPGEFRAAWFVESMVTQVLVIFIIRTRSWPWQSRPHVAMIGTALGALAVALALALGPFAAWFGFSPLPLMLLTAIAILAACYLVMAEILKRFVMSD
jgi:P-type Mg2+ transporter